MKYIVAGGRDFTNGVIAHQVLDTFTDIDTIISGDARGADFLGAMYATEKGIPLQHFPAYWDQYGKAAGYIRNAEMAEHGDALIAFWDGKSKGTMNMIKAMRLHKKPYWVYDYTGKLIENVIGYKPYV